MTIWVLATKDPSLVSLMPRVFLSMAVVIAAMWVASRFLQRSKYGPAHKGLDGKSSPQSDLTITARRNLGKHTSVMIVEADAHKLLVGVTDQRVSLLADLSATPRQHEVIETRRVTDNQHSAESQLRSRTYSQPKVTRTITSDDAIDLAPSTAWKGLLDQVREHTVRR